MTLREANHLQAQPDSMDYWDGVDWSGEPARFSRSGKRRKAVSDLIDLAPHQAPKAPSAPRGVERRSSGRVRRGTVKAYIDLLALSDSERKLGQKIGSVSSCAANVTELKRGYMFKAWLVTKVDTQQRAALTQLDEGQLPDGDVTVRIENSSINYKDALALTGKAPIIRRFPMVPGIDLGGIVEQSRNDNYHPGDKVVVNGWEIGEVHWGGLSEFARLRSEWLIKLPEPLTLFDAMALGTAGYTAMLAVMALEKFGVGPDKGEILVTGASGGVGGFAISFLAKLGYDVVASTGRLQESAYLKSLGAKEVIDRAQFSRPGKALGKERWAGAIENVGSHTLANVCATLKRGAAVACCGNAQGIDFPGTVAPFILRGVTLIGIDSDLCPMPERLIAWNRIAHTVDKKTISEITQSRPLSEAMSTAEEVLAGRIRGRVVIDIDG